MVAVDAEEDVDIAVAIHVAAGERNTSGAVEMEPTGNTGQIMLTDKNIPDCRTPTMG
jgi:hypothetical protein